MNTILNIPEETQTIEFKRLAGDKVVRKILQTIVAMANTDGGTIILGVDDPEKTALKGCDRIFGVEEDKVLLDEILKEQSKINPQLQGIQFRHIKAQGDKTIVLITVEKSKESLVSLSNDVFTRLNKSNKKLNPQEIVKWSYTKGFIKADKELVDVDFELLQTKYFDVWCGAMGISGGTIQSILSQAGLAKKGQEEILRPTRAAVLLFAEHPTYLMEIHCTVRVIQLRGTLERFETVPNYVSKPKTIGGPIIEVIRNSHEYVLSLLGAGIEIHSGFVNTFKIPERAVKEAITNAVIHRDYRIQRDVEIRVFEDRVEVLSPGLFTYNITANNIGFVRADGERNDLLVKHLREFPNPPNLNFNEGVRAMRAEMDKQNLYPPIFMTYPTYPDSVNVILLNEERPTEWEKVRLYLSRNRYIDNKTARNITGVVQMHDMSRMLKRWTEQGFLVKIDAESKYFKGTKYKLANIDEMGIEQ